MITGSAGQHASHRATAVPSRTIHRQKVIQVVDDALYWMIELSQTIPAYQQSTSAADGLATYLLECNTYNDI